MNFREWLEKYNEIWFSKGKAQASLFKPGPRDIKPKPHDVKLCGQGGGAGACQNSGQITAKV